VERAFHHKENNFLAGREFADLDTLNRDAIAWCDKVNATHKRRLHASPRELFAAEKPRLKPLPLWVPEVYALHHRIVDVEGYVNVHTNRYSAPWRLIGRRIEVRETKEHIELFDGPRLVASHKRASSWPSGRSSTYVTDPSHRPPRGESRKARSEPSTDEKELLRIAPELAEYVASIKRHGRGLRDIRRLLGMASDFPRGPLMDTVRVAMSYGLFDLERVETMLLRSLKDQFFLVPGAASADTDALDIDSDSDGKKDPDDR
jgi:hypothetical protein